MLFPDTLVMSSAWLPQGTTLMWSGVCEPEALSRLVV